MTDAATWQQAGAACADTDDVRIIERPFFRVKRRSVALAEHRPPPKPRQVHRPAKVAQQLALAHHLQEAIDQGTLTDRADVARRLGLTRARVTQLFDLLMLAPDIQEAILGLEAVDGVEPMAERALREVVSARSWAEQRARWDEQRTSARQGATRLPN